MFLKTLSIDRNDENIRRISFRKGINLIVDETQSTDKKKSGNNVGKTTVLRLVDFCFGGAGKNIYSDTEFKNKGNNQVERFLKERNVIVSLALKDDLSDEGSREILIRRNFQAYSKKIQEIDGQSYNDAEFSKELMRTIFRSSAKKPTFRQVVAKNIRDEKNRLRHTVKVLHPNTTKEEYEALYLFWLGIDVDNSGEKQRLLARRKIESQIRKRFEKEATLSQVKQSLLVVLDSIESLETKKNGLNLNPSRNEDIASLTGLRGEISEKTTHLTRLELRKALILESKDELDVEHSDIDSEIVGQLYLEAKALIPDLQKTFEDTLEFHNRMAEERLRYITKEIPELDAEISASKSLLSELAQSEREMAKKIVYSDTFEDLQNIIKELTLMHEQKGKLEDQEANWKSSDSNLKEIEESLGVINADISTKDDLVQERVAKFNKHFAAISGALYGEQFVLSADMEDRGYELNVSSISGNLGTGKKKGQIAAFDFAYIRFAEEVGINCLHFILHDQVENIHDNQLSQLILNTVGETNCQYVVPVLRDKLPDDIDAASFEIVRLSQEDKLFRLS